MMQLTLLCQQILHIQRQLSRFMAHVADCWGRLVRHLLKFLIHLRVPSRFGRTERRFHFVCLFLYSSNLLQSTSKKRAES